MERALAGIPEVHRVVEVLLIATETWQQHKHIMDKVLNACTKNNIAINPSKVQFAQPEVTFSGYSVFAGGYAISQEIAQGIKDFPEPTNRSEI